MVEPFVPADFVVPVTFDGPGFRLEPLGPHHNERDHEAWMSSIDHIGSTPGFPFHDGWPTAMSLEDNLGDLVAHAEDFSNRIGFTYSVVDGEDVVGCLYIYPTDSPGHDAEVRSWVTSARADLDVILWETVATWLATTWPFTHPQYAPRT